MASSSGLSAAVSASREVMKSGVRWIMETTSSTVWDFTEAICGGRGGVVVSAPSEFEVGGRGKGVLWEMAAGERPGDVADSWEGVWFSACKDCEGRSEADGSELRFRERTGSSGSSSIRVILVAVSRFLATAFHA